MRNNNGKHRQIFRKSRYRQKVAQKKNAEDFLIFCVVLVCCNSTYHGRNHGNHYRKDDN